MHLLFVDFAKVFGRLNYYVFFQLLDDGVNLCFVRLFTCVILVVEGHLV